MTYVNPDYPTKKEFKAAVKDGAKLITYNPSGMYPTVQFGWDTVEGPHYPRPHKWYAAVYVQHGIVIKVK